MRLKRRTFLSPREESAIRQAMGRYKVIPAHHDLGWEGRRPAHTTILLDGLMCRYIATPDGRRQILSFVLPGDFCDLSAFLEGCLDHAIGTLSSCTIAAIEHGALEQLINAHTSIRDALWRTTLQDAAIYRASICNIGRRSAYQRLAHLFCEIAVRLDSVGMKRSEGYEFLATQVDLSDALGLSVVHVNRMLQQLRDDYVFTHRGNTFAIHDWTRLTKIAGFNPAYLESDQRSSMVLSAAPDEVG